MVAVTTTKHASYDSFLFWCGLWRCVASYVESMRYPFIGNLSFTYVGDKSRDSGRDWLVAHVYGYEVKNVSWMQTVASCVHLWIPLVVWANF